MGLFDIGRPTGRGAGRQAYTEDRLSNEKETIANSKAQAEFMDYMDAAETRQIKRRAERVQARNTVAQEKTQLSADLAENQSQEAGFELNEAVSEEQLRIAPETFRDAAKLRKSNRQFPSYQNFKENQEAGVPNAENYAATRAGLLKAADNPQNMNAELNKLGITEEFTPEGMKAMMMQTGLALHQDRKLVNAMHLKDMDLRIAQLKAANVKTKNLEVKDPTPEQIAMQASVGLGMAPEMLARLGFKEGDELEVNSAAYNIANLIQQTTRQAARNNIGGDSTTSPEELSKIMWDILETQSGMLSEEEGMLWWRGSKVHGPTMDKMNQWVIQELDSQMRMGVNAGKPINQVYTENRERIHLMLADINKTEQAQYDNRNTKAEYDRVMKEQEEAARASANEMADRGATDTTPAPPTVTVDQPTQPTNPVTSTINEGIAQGKARQGRETFARDIGRKLGLQNIRSQRHFSADNRDKIMSYARSNEFSDLSTEHKQAFLKHFKRGLSKNQRKILDDLAGN